MRNETKNKFLLNLINLLIFVFLILFHYNSFVSIKIGNANPMVPLALLVAVAFFCSETTACFTGLAVGILVDSVASTKGFFNMIIFFFAGLLVSLTVRYLFNNNLRSCITVGLLSGAFYFIMRWLFFFAFNCAISESLRYLLAFALPSAVYTAIFVIPFYYFEKFLFSRLH